MHADNTNPLHIRPALKAEAEPVIALVLRSFDDFIAQDYTAEGVNRFHTDVTVASLVEAIEKGEIVLLALKDSDIAGVVKVRDETHISWLYVSEAIMSQGIGRQLPYAAVQEIKARHPDTTATTLNASPYGLPIYSELGFDIAGDEISDNGMRMTPMQAAIGVFQLGVWGGPITSTSSAHIEKSKFSEDLTI